MRNFILIGYWAYRMSGKPIWEGPWTLTRPSFSQKFLSKCGLNGGKAKVEFREIIKN